MKSRDLNTTPVLIVSNYDVSPHFEGKFLHTFTPENTEKKYQFLANEQGGLEPGARYNIGYYVGEDGKNWVDVAASAKADDVDPHVSHYVARKYGEELRKRETAKSDDRVVHRATDGKYLGRKYAWRIYGMAIPEDAFYLYVEDRKHPIVPCRTLDSNSFAFKEAGLDVLMDELIKSAVKIGGNRFKSHLFPSKKWFQIKGISAITDKK